MFFNEGYAAASSGPDLERAELTGEAIRLTRAIHDLLPEDGVVQEGTVTFTVGGGVVEVTGGQVVVRPAGMPHKFVNPGTGRLRQIDINASDQFVTEWLEDRADRPG